jgi:hypothetical protein
VTVCVIAGCGRPVEDALCCQACADRLARWLGDIPALADDLDTTLARLSRQGDRVGSRSAETPLPWDQRASAAAYNLRSMLVGNVRMLAGEETLLGPACPACSHETCSAIRTARWPADEVPAMALWLLARVEWIRHHPSVDEVLDEVGYAVGEARRVIDSRPSLWYAGRCLAATPAGPCQADLYAQLTAVWVTCPRCRTAYAVAERRDWLLEAAEDQLATAAEAARFLTAYYGEVVSANRITQWKARARVVAHGVDSSGAPTFRVGDLLVLVAAEPARGRRTA